MNNTELYIAASEAIALWVVNYDGPCVLSIQNEKVVCSRPPDKVKTRYNPLYVTRFEVLEGMKQARWTSLGNALLILYSKDSKCQTPQKL